jgi:ATP-binding cassette subfamily B protein
MVAYFTMHCGFTRRVRLHDAGISSRLQVESSASTFSALMQRVFSLGGLIVWIIGGRDVLCAQMTLGSLMAFLAYLAMFYTPLSTLAQLTTWLTSFLTASQRVFELLDTPVEISEPARAVKLPRMQGHIRFEKVTFGYERHQPLFKDFDLEIRPGEMIGLVGRSGSGKTTLANLICRFYDVDAGQVTIDGRDVRTLAREDLRCQVGVVLQEPFLFRGTVWENLLYGRTTASPEEAFTVAKGANAHDFIVRLPLGYDTTLGERGVGLSGGEKQRLSIARALLYDPRVLILDEATSSVDTEAEKAIQDALAVLTRGRTTIAVAHRLSTLQSADRIVVLVGPAVFPPPDHGD